MPMVTSLAEFLTAEECIEFRTPAEVGRSHPVSLLLIRDEGVSQHLVNVETALKNVSRVNPEWLARVKLRIVAREATESASALAELRAYSALLAAGFEVDP